MHPIAFNLGSLTIYWYGILMGVAFVAGFWTAGRRGLRDGLRPEAILDLGTFLIVGAIIGARVTYVVSYWDRDFAGRPLLTILNLRDGGLVYYGGFIGAMLAGLVVAKFKKFPVWKMTDVFAPSVALGSAIGRIGCLMTGCCFGKVCELPWAIRFPNQSPAWQTQEATHLIGPLEGALPVHPTAIYDSLLNFGLYFTMAWLYRRKKFDGQVFAVYLMAYAVTRSVSDAFRGDYPAANLHGGLTPAHLVSIGIFIAGAVLFRLRSHRRETT